MGVQGPGASTVWSCSRMTSICPSMWETRSPTPVTRIRSSETSSVKLSRALFHGSDTFVHGVEAGIHVLVLPVETLVHLGPEVVETLVHGLEASVHLRPEIAKAPVHGAGDGQLQKRQRRRR